MTPLGKGWRGIRGDRSLMSLIGLLCPFRRRSERESKCDAPHTTASSARLKPGGGNVRGDDPTVRLEGVNEPRRHRE